MIKQNGGIFGRNPTFNDVEVEGDLTVDGNYVVDGNINVGGDVDVDGSVGCLSINLGDTPTHYTVFNQDIPATEYLKISSYSSVAAAQFLWLQNVNGKMVSIGDIDGVGYSLATTWNSAMGTITSEVEDASHVIETSLVTTKVADVILTVSATDVISASGTSSVSVGASAITSLVGDSSIVIDDSTVSLNGALNVNTATGNISADLSAVTALSVTASSSMKGATSIIGASLIVQGTGTITTTSTAQTTILSLSSTTYTSVKYFVQARNTTTNRYQITEIVATRNATTTVVTATPVDTNSGGIAGTYAVDISGGSFRLRVTPQAASSTVFKAFYTAVP